MNVHVEFTFDPIGAIATLLLAGVVGFSIMLYRTRRGAQWWRER